MGTVAPADSLLPPPPIFSIRAWALTVLSTERTLYLVDTLAVLGSKA
jgi:hypothetical protein